MPPPELVATHVRGDREGPGAHREVVPIARAGAVNAQERRLQQLVAHRAISKGAEKEAVHLGCQRREQAGERALVPAAYAAINDSSLAPSTIGYN